MKYFVNTVFVTLETLDWWLLLIVQLLLCHKISKELSAIFQPYIEYRKTIMFVSDATEIKISIFSVYIRLVFCFVVNWSCLICSLLIRFCTDGSTQDGHNLNEITRDIKQIKWGTFHIVSGIKNIITFWKTAGIYCLNVINWVS